MEVEVEVVMSYRQHVRSSWGCVCIITDNMQICCFSVTTSK